MTLGLFAYCRGKGTVVRIKSAEEIRVGVRSRREMTSKLLRLGKRACRRATRSCAVAMPLGQITKTRSKRYERLRIKAARNNTTRLSISLLGSFTSVNSYTRVAT